VGTLPRAGGDIIKTKEFLVQASTYSRYTGSDKTYAEKLRRSIKNKRRLEQEGPFKN
jgi:hypothetical protein